MDEKVEVQYESIHPSDRRIALLVSPETADKITRQIDWKKVLLASLSMAFSGPVLQIGVFPLIKVRFPEPDNLFKNKRRRILFPLLDIQRAREVFTFPPGHPTDGAAYACSEIVPNLYVPLASFHDFMWQHKMSSFTTLCANLGAKKVEVTYVEENGREITGSVNIPGVTKGSVDVAAQSTTSGRIFREFEKPDFRLRETKEGWITTEPTWWSMQEERLLGGLLRSTIEINYSDDMGINSKIGATIKGLGIDIGGKFKKFAKKRWLFSVEFWPKGTKNMENGEDS